MKRFESTTYNQLPIPNFPLPFFLFFLRSVEDLSEDEKKALENYKKEKAVYEKREKEVKKIHKQEAEELCNQIISILEKYPKKPYRNLYGEGDKWGGRLKSHTLKYYSEFGLGGYCGYLVLNGVDVYDFLSRIVDIDQLIQEKKIIFLGREDVDHFSEESLNEEFNIDITNLFREI